MKRCPFSARYLPPAGTRQRIGLFGGSFDPPHEGHRHVCKTALGALRLDQVWWFPTPGNPLKQKPQSYERRLSCIRQLIANDRAVRVSDIEQRTQIHHTVDLIRLLQTHCPHARFVWIMGADNLVNFHLWKNWHRVAEQVPIAVVARPGAMLAAQTSRFARFYNIRRLPDRAAKNLTLCKPPVWVYLKARLCTLSSSAIRGRRQP